MDNDETKNIKKRWLRLPDVANILQVSRRTVERLCHAGKLRYEKVNHLIRITEEDLKQFEMSVHRGGSQ
jgi:excisionase family DNA binding protein